MAKRKSTRPRSKHDISGAEGSSATSHRNKRPVGEHAATLSALRCELDELDKAIVDAINRRAAIAEEIGRLKRAQGQEVYDPAREAEVLDKAQAQNAGPLSGEAVRAVFREIVSGSRAVQSPVRVSYLGPEFTFSHLAAIERFGHTVELLPVGTIAAVFEEVERGHADYGVVPMENSTDGRVSDTLECFSHSQARICAELPLRIHHCLLGLGKRDSVRVVYSKPQPLSQCRNWLAYHMGGVELREVASTAEAARQAKEDPRAAAVASAQAGTNYGLPILERNIEDNPDNVTRFAVIAREAAPPSGSDKTSLMVEIAHRPGALADAMAIFKRNRLNMTWIESFPIPGSRGRYLFFIEFVGHQDDDAARRAIVTLRKNAQRLEVLGSYAQAESVG